jgi:hypothetical protein
MRTSVLASLAFAALLSSFGACGPSASHPTGQCDSTTDLLNDPNNCGVCGLKCTSSQTCNSGSCVAQSCTPGDSRACYDGADGTQGVGPCVGGMQTCGSDGYWSSCDGEVIPTGEKCGNSIDDNCNGMVDENVDNDGDGFTTCAGDCCDSASDGCTDPKLVNPGAFDAAGNNLDDDCDGKIDESSANCDSGIASNTGNAADFAKAIDICETATAGDKKWGLLSAGWSLTNGTGTPDANGHSVRDKFGTNLTPKGGASLMEISSGVAADANDNNPKYDSSQSYAHTSGASSPFPADFVTANGGSLPNAPGCPDPSGSDANDPEMLTLKIRVPTNAKSFSMNVNFYSYEFPEWTCSPYNDFFVVLLDSAYNGQPANPTDKNLAFYTDAAMKKYPVGVNLAYGNTGLFTQCKDGATGCAGILDGGKTGNIMTCTGTNDLAGTGFDQDGLDECDSGQYAGGGTGWLQTSGNVVGGETITLRIAIWDTSDENLDSTAVIDNFQWSVDVSNPGTVVVN